MSKIDIGLYGANTNAVRTGHECTNEGENSEALFLSSSFTFKNAAEAAARFSGDEQGNIYSRFTNPTVRIFEERLAAMEGGERCVATSSGMSAILSTCMALLSAGDHIVSSANIFGTSVNLFKKILPKFGVQTSFVPLTNYSAWEQAICEETRILFLETPSNPLTEIADIKKLADLAHSRDCLLVVDNCFCTPVLQRPFDLGADLVIHSATKYLDGQGRCVGGAVIGTEELVGEEVFAFLRTAGPTMSPFNAWVFLKGLETLGIRMREHCKNAQEIAEWLTQQKGISKVFYPGLPTHPQHALAKEQQSGFGGVVSFELEGAKEAAWKLIDNIRLFSITANLGDTKSTITHPATTTHNRLSDDEREAVGISDGLVRLSVGLEDVADIQADLQNGFAALVK
jgi:O-succinylhomoserine sulfhydrylase